MRVPAIVGAYPEPFANGLEGKRRPVRVECEEVDSPACSAARDRLNDVGVPTSGSSLGAPGTEAVTRLVVARWPRARIVRGASGLEDGPESTGVFARFSATETRSSCSTSRARTARRVRRGDGVGLVLALQPRAEELVWIVTALDDAGPRGRRARARRAQAAQRLRGGRDAATGSRSFRWWADEPDPRLPQPPERAPRRACGRGRRATAARSRSRARCSCTR